MSIKFGESIIYRKCNQTVNLKHLDDNIRKNECIMNSDNEQELHIHCEYEQDIQALNTETL